MRSFRAASIGLIALAIAAGTLADRPRPHPPLTIGGYRVLAADFHTHSSLWSDAALTPWGLVLEAERFEVGQQALFRQEGSGEDLLGHLEQLEDPWVHHRIDDGGAHLAALDDMGFTQHGQLMREMRRLDPNLGQQLPHRMVTLAQHFQDPDPRRMTQGLEELRLQLVHGPSHRRFLSWA